MAGLKCFWPASQNSDGRSEKGAISEAAPDVVQNFMNSKLFHSNFSTFFVTPTVLVIHKNL